MSLTWNWDKKIGDMEVLESYKGEPERRYTIDLYNGNACLIMIHEWTTEDGTEKYSMFGFFLDIPHAKNCLGLNKKEGYTENIYNKPYQKVIKFRFNKKCRDLKKIIPLIIEAFDNINIEIYTEKEP